MEKVGSSSNLQPGQRVVAAGWPVGTWQQYISIPESKLVRLCLLVDNQTGDPGAVAENRRTSTYAAASADAHIDWRRPKTLSAVTVPPLFRHCCAIQ